MGFDKMSVAFDKGVDPPETCEKDSVSAQNSPSTFWKLLPTQRHLSPPHSPGDQNSAVYYEQGSHLHALPLLAWCLRCLLS